MSSIFVVANARTAVTMTTINSCMIYSGYCILQRALDYACMKLGKNPPFHFTRNCQPQEIPHKSIVPNPKTNGREKIYERYPS